MKKLKYILASVIIAGSFASCESESIDEKLKDENLKTKPVLRFDLNDKTSVVTDDVYVNWGGSNTLSITAKMSIKDPEAISRDTEYKAATLYVFVSQLATANFPARLNVDNPSAFLSTAAITIDEVDEDGKVGPVTYSTDNAPEESNPGYLNITSIVDKSRFLNGNFDYTLYPPEGSIMQPQRLTKGEMHYIVY